MSLVSNTLDQITRLIAALKAADPATTGTAAAIPINRENIPTYSDFVAYYHPLLLGAKRANVPVIQDFPRGMLDGFRAFGEGTPLAIIINERDHPTQVIAGPDYATLATF